MLNIYLSSHGKNKTAFRMGKLKEFIISCNNFFSKAYHTFFSGLGSEKGCWGEVWKNPNPSHWRQKYHGGDSLHRWIHSVTMWRLGGSPITEIFTSRYFVSRVRVWLQTHNQWTCRYFRCVIRKKNVKFIDYLLLHLKYLAVLESTLNREKIKTPINPSFPHFILLNVNFFNDVF